MLVEVILLAAFAVPIWARRVSVLPDKAKPSRCGWWPSSSPGTSTTPARTASSGAPIPSSSPPAPIRWGATATIRPARTTSRRSTSSICRWTGRRSSTSSSKDVIHSFFLPTMRVKQDAIPGQVIPVYFTPTMVNPPEAVLPGCAVTKTCWEIACAQLCGLTHYRHAGLPDRPQPGRLRQVAGRQRAEAPRAPVAARRRSPLPLRPRHRRGRPSAAIWFRVGAGLDGRLGARPALRGRLHQGGSSPQPALQTRPYPKHRDEAMLHVQDLPAVNATLNALAAAPAGDRATC